VVLAVAMAGSLRNMSARAPGRRDHRGCAVAGKDESSQFWYNVVTKQVEVGHQSSWKDLMGPYPSRAAAERALEHAAERTKAWDDDDARDGR